MDQLIVLGTGNAMVTKCYNTCFALRHADAYCLVDAGGGNGILAQMQHAGIPFSALRHLIVTHAHCDHLLGVVWVVRKIATLMKNGAYDGDFHIWAHQSILDAIVTMCHITLQEKFVKLLGTQIRLCPIADGSKAQILDQEFTFFDIHSTKLLQHGFTVRQGEWKLTCLGDEPYNPLCHDYVAGSDWLLCEAFCLYSQRERFKPYEKHHSTVKDAALLAQQLQISNLVLWHTEDANYENRKALYTQEAAGHYTGHLFVPYDLEVLDLSRDPEVRP